MTIHRWDQPWNRATSDTLGGSAVWRQQKALLPLETTLQQGICNGIKTLLNPVDLISSQHQPGLDSSLKATSLERVHPQSDRCVEQNIAQFFRQSIAVAELLGDQWVVEEGSQKGLKSNAIKLQVAGGAVLPRTIGTLGLGWLCIL